MLSQVGPRKGLDLVTTPTAGPRAVSSGDGDGLSPAVFRDLYPGLRRFAGVVGDLDMDPDDLVQEAVARFLQRARLTQPGRLDAYLRAIVFNVVRDERRRMASRPVTMAELPDAPRPTSYPSDLASLLEALELEDRALLYLTAVDGEPIAAAAEVVGLSAVTARKRLSRARRRLRETGGTDDDI